MADDKISAFNFKEPARQLIDQTLCTTPVPQASSTANRDAKMSLTPIKNPINIQPTEGHTYLSDLLKPLENSSRQSIGSNSSLGILKQDDIQGTTPQSSRAPSPMSPSSSVASAGTTPQSSRAPSPMSPSSSVASADGNLQLESTHTSLVWTSHPVHSKTQKNCLLRNKSLHREKLLISISGSNNCFKLLSDKKKLEDKMQLSLQSMESKSLTVVMLPTHAGAFTSSLKITRINSSTEKKVLPLYGYGGKAKLIPQGVSQDADQRMWIYLDNTTLSTSFILKNVGDAPAFVKTSEGVIPTGISISPPECLILPEAYITVEISLTTTADRLEYLLSQPGNSFVSVTKLILTLGDESTRHRLNRLYRKLCTTEQVVDDLWNSRLKVLNGLFSDKDMKEVRALRDPVSSFDSLWDEGIQKWNIGVLVERTLLETMRSDYTPEFMDLQSTIMEETICCPNLLPYKVSPCTLTISSKECSQELTLENMSQKTVVFECQPSAGLHVIPICGVISSVSSVKLYVSWIEPVVPTTEGKICVTFGNEEKFEVPVVVLNSKSNLKKYQNPLH